MLQLQILKHLLRLKSLFKPMAQDTKGIKRHSLHCTFYHQGNSIPPPPPPHSFRIYRSPPSKGLRRVTMVQSEPLHTLQAEETEPENLATPLS